MFNFCMSLHTELIEVRVCTITGILRLESHYIQSENPIPPSPPLQKWGSLSTINGASASLGQGGQEGFECVMNLQFAAQLQWLPQYS